MYRKYQIGAVLFLTAAFLVSPLVSNAKSSISINRYLSRGMNGGDVTELQQLLSSDKEIYPEGMVTGFFGKLTENAVKRFQKKYNISQVGQVGPLTLQKVILVFGNATTSATSTINVNNYVSINQGRGNDKKDDRVNIDIENGSSSVIMSGHKILLCHKGNTISVDYHAIAAHINHGDSVGLCNNGQVATSTDNLYVYGVTANPFVAAANIHWLTNISADSKVWYGTTTPLIGSAGAQSVGSSVLTTDHNFTLTGLAPNTLYYYNVVSSTGNKTATSSQYSFYTAQADSVAPYIFNVSISKQYGTTTVSWMTNETTTGKLWYATIPDVMNASGKHVVEDSALGMNHSAVITSLVPSTTYYFLITATDIANNTSTSTSNLYTFTTDPFALSNLGALNVASTSATVSWLTNWPADSKLWYATSTPVLSSPSLQLVSQTALVTNHNLSLSSLTASTTYYYIAVSKDAVGNIATSSVGSLTTQ